MTIYIRARGGTSVLGRRKWKTSQRRTSFTCLDKREVASSTRPVRSVSGSRGCGATHLRFPAHGSPDLKPGFFRQLMSIEVTARFTWPQLSPWR
jgi:hypothetical protein